MRPGAVPTMGEKDGRAVSPGAPDERAVSARRFEPPCAPLEIGDQGGRFRIGREGNRIHLRESRRDWRLLDLMNR